MPCYPSLRNHHQAILTCQHATLLSSLRPPSPFLSHALAPALQQKESALPDLIADLPNSLLLAAFVVTLFAGFVALTGLSDFLWPFIIAVRP